MFGKTSISEEQSIIVITDLQPAQFQAQKEIKNDLLKSESYFQMI